MEKKERNESDRLQSWNGGKEGGRERRWEGREKEGRREREV